MISALSKESPESQDHQIVAGSTDSDIFLNEVKLFRNDGCKPETYTSDDGSKQMQVNFPDETIDLEPTKNYLNNKIDPNKWNSFGNQVDRALFIIRDYQSQLSYHYYLMFDLYRKYGMEKFVDQFNKYLETFKKDARLLCYTSSPSKQQFRLANKYTSKETVNNLDLEWQTEFNSWIDKVAAAQEKAAVLYDKAYWKNKTYEDTVYCEEKNTSLQDYKLVKCYP
jgi:hypothetical protein